MPFGYKNRPSIFQRVMQNVLAPFLWIFVFVYINDIIIFSLTLEDCISHLNRVFKAIEKSGVILATTKCHFRYQSLLLLGQKVSRLGLLTHKEKVDTILQLDKPKNYHDLQVFLVMIVYFSVYIPFCTWIAGLKKSTKWEWTKVHSEAFELHKQVLVNAPVCGYAKCRSPYRLYLDACNFGLATTLQQVQRIQLKDLKGTKAYKCCDKAVRIWFPFIEYIVISIFFYLKKIILDVEICLEMIQYNWNNYSFHLILVYAWVRPPELAISTYLPNLEGTKVAGVRFRSGSGTFPANLNLDLTDNVLCRWTRTWTTRTGSIRSSSGSNQFWTTVSRKVEIATIWVQNIGIFDCTTQPAWKTWCVRQAASSLNNKAFCHCGNTRW